MLPIARAGFHVIAPDQRGYGRTTGWDGDYDGDLGSFRLLNLVRDALGLVSALGYRPVAAVVGHDFGSPVAAWCALVRPDVFRSVVLMSAPFAGPPALPFDTANDAPPGSTTAGPSGADIHAELAALARPRKHYHWYYSTREADANMRNCPQGVHAFLRAYYHYKSADWKREPALPAEGMDRRRAGEDAHLLHHGPGQGDGGNRGAGDAVRGRDRRVQVASRRRAERVQRGVRQDRVPGRPAVVSVPDQRQVQRRARNLLRPHDRCAVLLHRREERLGRLPEARRPGEDADQRLHSHAGLSSRGRGRALGAAGAAGEGERAARWSFCSAAPRLARCIACMLAPSPSPEGKAAAGKPGVRPILYTSPQTAIRLSPVPAWRADRSGRARRRCLAACSPR